LTQRRRWLPTLLLIPFAYLLGWIIIYPLRIFYSGLDKQSLSLFGTLISFLVFLSLLPNWVRLRWGNDNCFFALGLNDSVKTYSFKYFMRGFSLSLGLLFCVVIPLLLSSWGTWTGSLNSGVLINAFFLVFVIGLAEELIFRGWLLVEMNQLFGPRLGLIIHTAIFSLVHARTTLDLWGLFGLLIGLFLLGIVLALMRKIDKGSLWGCVGLHGGLVGGWFLISAGLIEVSPEIPGWLFGPGGSSLNPLGGLLSIFVLIFILWRQRTLLAIGGRPFNGARKASSRGALP